MIKFEILFLASAKEFLDGLDAKTREKILFNIWKSKYSTDPKLFKKLNNEIWEFRTLFRGRQFRFLAFWDRRGNKKSLVITTHGFEKKTQKIPQKEIVRAESLMKEYFDRK